VAARGFGKRRGRNKVLRGGGRVKRDVECVFGLEDDKACVCVCGFVCVCVSVFSSMRKSVCMKEQKT
jgi:hypothetical protein